MILGFSLLFMGISYGQYGLSTPGAANELQNLLNYYQTYQADYTQTTYDSLQRLSQRASGRMMLMRPGKFRWETDMPEHQWIISDGNTLWIYDLDLQQATHQALSKHNAADPAILLSGKINEVLKNFTVIKKDGWYDLRPNFALSSFKNVQLQFVNNQLTEVRVVDKLNQSSDFQFSNIQINAPINPALFQFSPPNGVQVLQQP